MKENFKPAFSKALAGRNDALGRLHNYLRMAASGSGRFVVISGEAGIGKTSLIESFCAEADKNACVVGIDFSQFHAYEPYTPFVRLVERLTCSDAEESFELATEKEAASKNDPNPGNSDRVEMETLYSLQTSQSLVQQKLLRNIVEAAENETLVISLTKAHVAPLTTWKFIHYLCESITDKCILVIAELWQDGLGTVRGKQFPYTDILKRMNREGLLERIQLRRFDEKQVKQFLLATFKRKDFSSRFTILLREATGGSPKQIQTCLEKMYEVGLVFQHNGVWFDSEELNKEALFNLVSDETDVETVAKSIVELSPDFTTILRYTALLDGPVNHRVLSVVTNRSSVNVIKDMLALKNQMLLTSSDDENFMLKDAAVSSAVLEQISPKAQTAMHYDIATAIESADSVEPGERVYRLAYHYSHTNEHELAFKYLCRAGELAVENYAFLEARDFFKQAFELRSCVEIDDKVETVQLLIWLAWLDRVFGNWDESIEQYKMALELCSERESRLKNQILLQQGLSYFRVNNWMNAKSCMEKCLNDKGNLSKFDQAMANYGLGNIHFELGNYKKSCEFYETARSIAQELEAKQLVANIFNNLGAIENIRGQRMRAIAFYSKSIPMFKGIGDNFGLARVYHNIGMTHADDENWQKAIEFYGQSLSVSDVMGLVPLKSITFLNRAYASTNLKRFNEAREYNFKAYRLLQRLKDELGMAEYYKIQGIIEREEGNWTLAQRHLNNALEKFAVVANKLGYAETQQELGILALAQNDHEGAGSWFENTISSFQDLGLHERVKSIENQLRQLPCQANPPTESLHQGETV